MTNLPKLYTDPGLFGWWKKEADMNEILSDVATDAIRCGLSSLGNGKCADGCQTTDATLCVPSYLNTSKLKNNFAKEMKEAVAEQMCPYLPVCTDQATCGNKPSCNSVSLCQVDSSSGLCTYKKSHS